MFVGVYVDERISRALKNEELANSVPAVANPMPRTRVMGGVCSGGDGVVKSPALLTAFKTGGGACMVALSAIFPSKRVLNAVRKETT